MGVPGVLLGGDWFSLLVEEGSVVGGANDGGVVGADEGSSDRGVVGADDWSDWSGGGV